MTSHSTDQPDADTQTVLSILAEEGGFLSEDLKKRRAVYDRVFSELTAQPTKQPKRELSVFVSEGDRELSAVLIEPQSVDGAPSGVIVFAHGGGWTMGSAVCYTPLGRCLSAETGLPVLLVDYPLAPEHPHPAGRDAVTMAAQWALQTYDAPVVLAGDSAGGHLAFLASRQAALRGRLAALCLIYPVLDLRPGADYASRRRYGRGDHFLTSQGIIMVARHYCDGVSPDTEELSPILTENLANMPPTCFVLPALDPLHDEGKALCEKMRAAGVAADVIDVPQTIHGCLSFSAHIGAARSAFTQTSAWLQKHLQHTVATSVV